MALYKCLNIWRKKQGNPYSRTSLTYRGSSGGQPGTIFRSEDVWWKIILNEGYMQYGYDWQNYEAIFQVKDEYYKKIRPLRFTANKNANDSYQINTHFPSSSNVINYVAISQDGTTYKRVPINTIISYPYQGIEYVRYIKVYQRSINRHPDAGGIWGQTYNANCFVDMYETKNFIV